MKYRLVLIIGFIALVGYLAGFRQERPTLELITSGDSVNVIEVEVVESDEDRRVGLMGRESFTGNRGMLFVFKSDPDPVMWMKGMNFPIDMLFIGSDLRVNHIENSIPPCRATEDRNCPRYKSAFPSLYVLELPSGYVKQNEIGLRDQVVLPSGF